MDTNLPTVDRQEALREHATSSFAPDNLTLVSLSEFLPGFGFGKTTWYAKVRSGEAPPSVKVTGKRVAWVKSEVLEYRARLIAERKLGGAL
jgi:predicted DNA-binding transcriptional regulator AlpA